MAATSRLSNVCVALLSLIVAGCAQTPAGGGRPDLGLGPVVRVDARDYPNDDAVVLLERHELTFSFSASKRLPYGQLVEIRRLQVLREAGAQYATLVIPYDDRSAVFRIEGRLHRRNGDVRVIPPEVLTDAPLFTPGSPAAKLYAGAGRKVAALRADVDDVIETRVVRVLRDPRWVEPVRISGALPVLRAEVVVDAPNVFDVLLRQVEGGRVVDRAVPRIPTRVRGTESGGEGVAGTRTAFVFDRVPAIAGLSEDPTLRRRGIAIHAQLRGYGIDGQVRRGLATWDDIADWYRAVASPMDKESLAPIVQASGITEGSRAARVSAVQKLLQDQIGDVVTGLHISALPRATASAMWQAKLGDGIDQARLGMALLDAAGVPATPVLVAGLAGDGLVPDMPSPAPFTDVLLAVQDGGRRAFLDPMHPFLPTGQLPGALQGARALLLAPDGAQFIDLPVDKADVNQRRSSYRFTLSADGTLTGQALIELTGLEAANARAVLAGQDPPAEVVERAVLGRAHGGPAWARVDVAERKALGDRDAPLKLAVLLAPILLPGRGSDSMPIRLESLVGRPLAQAAALGCGSALRLPYRFVEEVTVSVSLPERLGAKGNPAEGRYDDGFVEGRARWTVSRGALEFRRSLRTETLEIPKDDCGVVLTGLPAALAADVTVGRGGKRGGDAPF